jgi:hypothetical protein
MFLTQLCTVDRRFAVSLSSGVDRLAILQIMLKNSNPRRRFNDLVLPIFYAADHGLLGALEQ